MKKTIILKIDDINQDLSKIKAAAQIIRKGGLVAFPTETVYGLGADGLNSKACKEIYRVKKRPLKNPLILHIAVKKDVFKFSKKVPKETQKLIAKFWPGPLTLVLEKSSIVSDVVTGGGNTVAIRMPDNLIALNLIKYAKTPIAAPSANLSGSPSPTSARHVIEDLKDKIDIIIDGGKTTIGVESTVLDLTSKPFKILRPGGVTRENLSKVLSNMEICDKREDGIKEKGFLVPSYFSSVQFFIVNEKKEQIEEIKKMALKFQSMGKKVGLIITKEKKEQFKGFFVKIMGSEKKINTCASNLFSVLRDFSKEKINVLIVQGIKPEGIGLTIMNRFYKMVNVNAAKKYNI